MFVYSVRASGVKFFGILALTLVLLVALTVGGGAITASAGSASDASFTNIKTEEDRAAFLSGFGIKTAGPAIEEVAFVMPESFDRVMLGYNEIQKAQGFDLSRYARKKVTRFTYEITNCNELLEEGEEPYDGVVYANLLIYRGRVIGADISTADPMGFVKPLVRG